MHWTNRYLDIPFLPRGRDFSGCDCGGLVLLVLRERFGVTARDAEEEYETAHFSSACRQGRRVLAEALSEAMREWRPVPDGEAREGDLAEFAPRGVRCHVGIVIAPGRMLHVDERQGQACVEDIKGSRWGSLFTGYYRHAAM